MQIDSKIAPFLMFEGKAEDAMNFYQSLFPGSSVESIERWGEGDQGKTGSIKSAELSLAGLLIRLFDSPINHAFQFTPSISFFVKCESEEEIERLNEALSEDGMTLMPLDSYDFSQRFAWVQDRFGVSWQLDLA